MTQEAHTDYTVAVLEDAIQIMDVLKESREGLSLGEITQSSGYQKNKVFRILYTLEKHHLVERSRTGLYSLGLRLLEYGTQVQSQAILLEVSCEVMDWLVDVTKETIFLGVKSGSEALCIAARESSQSIRLYASVGKRAPLHLGGVPKTLLAHLPKIEREAYINGLDELNDADRKLLQQYLIEIYEQGYAVAVDELDRGVHSIAAPIYDQPGNVTAGISIAGPSQRFDDDTIDTYIELIQEAGDLISQKLGYMTKVQLEADML